MPSTPTSRPAWALRCAERLGRRGRRAQLAVHRDDGALTVAVAEAAVGVLHEMLFGVLFDERTGCLRATFESRVDRLVGRGVRVIHALPLREVETDVGKDLDCRIEQHGALDALWVEHGELENETADERVTHERRAPHSGCVERLAH